MENFEFDITQPAITMFQGKLIITAEDKDDAIRQINSLSQDELDDKVFWNGLIDDQSADPNGLIEVWDELGTQVNL
jgi:predicted Zn-dependent protease